MTCSCPTAENDLDRALEIKRALEARDLEVFLDRERVRHSYGVSTTIEKALRHSRMMLVYYSERYSRRLDAEEGLELIKRYRAIDDDEVSTVLSVVDQVGGHPMAVNQLAIGLRERVGLSTVLEQVGRELEGTTDTLAKVAILVESQLSTLDDRERAVLRLAAVCAPDPLPMRFVLAAAGLAENDLLAAARVADGRAPDHP